MDLATTPARRPMEPGLARRLWHVVLAVCHMVRRGLSRKRIMMDVHLLLGRGKLAGRALRGLLAHPGHGHGGGHHLTTYGGASRGGRGSSSSLASFYGHPREVEFSCTTTPSYPQHYGLFPFTGGSKGRGGGGRARGEYGGLDAAAVARAFEMLSAEVEAGTPAVGAATATATPSPMVAWILGRSPAGVRPLRVTDSPFPAVPEDGCCNDRVDAEADDFIRKFYEELRLQPTAATPDCYLRRTG